MDANFIKSEIRTANNSETIKKVLVGSKTRVSECHDFVWSRSLWKDMSNRITIEATVLLTFYLGIAYWNCYVDGIRGVDFPYFLATTLTMVGLGDISFSKQGSRLAAIATLPLGLVVIGFVITNIQAFKLGRSKSAIEKRQERTIRAREGNHEVGTLNRFDSIVDESNPIFEDDPESSPKTQEGFKKSLIYRTIVLMRSYAFIIFIGAVFFRLNEAEQKLQKQNMGVEMTWVDCFFFATVVSTTVGYGILTPQSTGAKIFCTVYFFVASTIVGSFITDFSGVLAFRTKKNIYAKVINSTVWVHKADLHQTGFIFQSDYVLFKLRQMKAVDESLISQLASRFHELDRDRSGLLHVGVEVPSAKQVRELQAAVEGTQQTVEQAWKESRLKNDQEISRTFDEMDNRRPTKLLESHDFKWSSSLYSDAWIETSKLIACCVMAYLLLGYLSMAYFEPTIANETWSSVKAWYFISATLSTVGFGDYAPLTQLSRMLSIFMIPFGLIILGLVLSAHTQYRLAKALKPGRDSHTMRIADCKLLFDVLDTDGNGVLTKEEVISGHSRLMRKKDEASDLFDYVSTDGETVKMSDLDALEARFRGDDIALRCAKLAAKYVVTVLIAALFFKLYGPEKETDLTWVDAFYLATVVATSIGYGNVVPASDGGRLFLTFYFLGSTVVVGSVFASLKELYIKDVKGAEINDKIKESTIHLNHLAIGDPQDPEKYFELSEADFVLFKLMQMQEIDEDLIEVLIDRFFEISQSGTRSLVVGVDIPNKEQVAEMEELTSGTGMTLQQAWEKRMADKWTTKNNPVLAHRKVGDKKMGTSLEDNRYVDTNPSSEGICENGEGTRF